MFTLTIQGQYYANGKKLRHYSYECNLPTLTAALSIVKNRIEQRKMPKLYPDFVAVRTRAITKTVAQAGSVVPQTDVIAEMTVEQLKQLVVKKNLPIDIAEYSDIITLRKDVTDATTDLEAFLALKEERAEEAALEKSINDLNPDIKEDGLGEVSPLGNAHTASPQEQHVTNSAPPVLDTAKSPPPSPGIPTPSLPQDKSNPLAGLE